MSIDIQALADGILQEGKKDVSEATLRIRVEHLLSNYLASIGVDYMPVHERRTITTGRRTDALFGTVILEYKKPGRLASPAEWKEAVNQLQGYLEEEARRAGGEIHRYVGILIDGQSIGFITHTAQEWSVIGPQAVQANSIGLALEYLRGLSRKPLDPILFSNDFGPHTRIARQAIRTLWQALQSPSNKTTMLYQEWKQLFGQISGYSARQLPEIIALEKEYALNVDHDMPLILFTVHTYYALLIKMLAVEILTLVRNGVGRSFIEQTSIQDMDALKKALEEMEDGGTFRNLQIENLMEGDFFSWYLDQWTTDVGEAIHAVLLTLQSYEPGTAILAPERVKDLLKHLYQYLVPATLRHDLGEFYTPDWLAQWVLDKAGYDGTLEQRILDPSCGTGTFLIDAINRAKEKAKSGPYSSQEILQAITKNIVGFDLNPLAVIAARTNYILALGDLLEAQSEPLVIPIFLADSIFSPSRRDTLAGSVCSYSIATQRGAITVDIPVKLIEQNQLADLLAEIEIAVLQVDADEDECLERVALRVGFTEEETALYAIYIKTLFREIRALELQHWNRIWTRIIKNYYASATVGTFDYIVGNPPWLRWTRLPAGYQETIKEYCIAYGLFSQDTYVGGIETDISTILTYSSVEKWLKQGGILAFLITQTVFKNMSSEGFRKFRLPDGTKLQVLEVHDMVALKPFENVANKTAALFLRKGAETTYPVPYIAWEKTKKAAIRSSMTPTDVQTSTYQRGLVAYPVYPQGGPWLTVEAPFLATVQHMIGKSAFHARKGITSDLNGVYWIELLSQRGEDLFHFRNLHTIGKHSVAPFEGLIERDIVFPLVRGRDTHPFYVEDSDIYLILPQNGMRGYPEADMRLTYRNALDYFRRYKSQLTARASYLRYHRKQNGAELGPYYSLWNVGSYTFAPHKVAWREVQNPHTFFASYIGPKVDPLLGEVPVVPDHKLYFVPCETAEEAYYLCGFLNSPAVRAFITGYVIDTQIATHITEYINIPRYDPQNAYHVELSNVASQIIQEHRTATSAEHAQIEEIVERLFSSPQ